MSYFYTDPEREVDVNALPNAEAFFMSKDQIAEADWRDVWGDPMESGWYVWACFPGCLPDGDPTGPYPSEAEAIAEWRAMHEMGDL